MKIRDGYQKLASAGIIIGVISASTVGAITPARVDLYTVMQQGHRTKFFKDIFNASGLAKKMRYKESLSFFVPRDSSCDDGQKKTLAAIHDVATARQFVLDHTVKGQVGVYLEKGQAQLVNYYPDLSSPSFEHTTIHPGEVLSVKTLSGKNLDIRITRGLIHVGARATILENEIYSDPGTHDEPGWSIAEVNFCGSL